ncbi:TnsD family Tn7-like transposition protein [Clostridium sp. ZS1]|uniref:TnsD family Tn7-like transposition protein n=1 Tax=Clostridium sp. ZS1 TaxID=2949989 RepID=UPI00207A8B2A|nr:TnsD family Tn7-like transposition protein [Clostridium sp. ZS1]
MSLYFPEIYDDEILYSVISRYHYYIGNLNTKKTLKQLFKNPNKIPTIELCCNIKIICKEINNSIYNENYIIRNHTNLPFYYPFLNINNQKYIIKMMKDNNAQGIYAKIGIVAGGICNKKNLYYCPRCVQDDTKKNGEAYFHRIHQIPGVLVCPIHLCKLEKYEETDNKRGRISLLKLNKKYIDFTTRYIEDRRINEDLIKIAKASQYLLNNYLKNINYDVLLQEYKNVLRYKGLVTPKNRVRQNKLKYMFKQRYNCTLLEILNSTIDDRESNWLRSILRKPKKYINPIRHILFILFIYEDIESFFSDDNENNIIKSSWPCLNKVCSYYKKDVITKRIVTSDYKTRQPVGTYKCKYCGFEYSRKLDYQYNDDIYKIGRIKSFGQVWKNKLISLINSKKYSINNMAKIMGCDPKTIVKYSKKLGEKQDINSKIMLKKSDNVKLSKNYQTIYSKDILIFKDTHPHCTRTDIRKALSKQYMWLYRNDKKWLYDNLPEIQIKKNLNNKLRVDWEKRDNEIFLKIRKLYIKIMRSLDNIRITESIIGSKLGISALLYYYLEKLPKTQKYLSKIIETVEEFQIRRVKKICRLMNKNDIQIKQWKVMRLSGLKNTCSKNVIDTINYYIEKQKNNISL